MASQQSHGGDGKRLTDRPDSTKSGQDVTEKYEVAVERLLDSPSSHDKALLYLYQTQDEDFVRRMMSHISHLWINGSVPEKNQKNLLAKAVSYCLEKSESSHSIMFSQYTMSSESQRILSPGLRKCSELSLQDCHLMPYSTEDLHFRNIRHPFRFLLNMSQDNLQDSCVKSLCEILRHPDCILEALELRSCKLTSSCCEDLNSVITTNRSLTKLDLSHNNLRDSGVKRLCEGLRHPDCVLQELRLRSCRLTSSCLKDLRSVITNRSLITLDLSHNNLQNLESERLYLNPRQRVLQELWLQDLDLISYYTEDLRYRPIRDSRVKSLCEILRHPDCILEALVLRSCKLTSSCCEDLNSVITNRSLTKLDLSYNNLQDSGLKRLCEGLRHPDCVLQELRLCCCGLTSSCLKDLRSLITNRSLITLDLSHNNLRDSELERLYLDLRHPDCVLQELWLEQCNLTESFCEDPWRPFNRNRTRLHLEGNNLRESAVMRPREDPRLWDCHRTPFRFNTLRSSVTTVRDLTKLDLSYTGLGDLSLKCLCAGLRHPGCFLQELRLQLCGLTASCCEVLRSAMIINRSLTKLDLSLNNLQDSGVKHLCEGLGHPGCILKELRLERCGLTPSCCEDLRSIATTNRSLIKLDLSHNNLQDSGVKSLFEGLGSLECTLKELRLERCGLTSSCCEDLHSVIITNRSLIKLDLSHNKLHNLGVKRLCEGLGRPECTLKELRLERCGLTSSCCEDLSSVITNRSLTKLDLSHNNLQDSGVKRLCEGLRHPDCVLQELRLCHCKLTFSSIEELLSTANRSLAKLDLSHNIMPATGITCPRWNFSY